jgi:hypothetical protein
MGFNLRTIWNCLSVFLIGTTLYLFKSIFVYREEAEAMGLEINDWSDLYTGFWILMLIFFLRHSISYFLKPMLTRRLKETDPLNYELKKNKVTKEFLSLLWYIFATVYGNIALYNHPYVPNWLNGGGTCKGLASNYGTHRGDPVINKFYLIQSAHHMFSLVDHVFIQKKEKDWAEMSLHHLCAMAAILFSYYTNQIGFGATILLIHDYGDVFLNLGKFWRDMRILPHMPWIIDIEYVLIFVSWFFPRVVLVSGCVLPAGIYYRHFEVVSNDPKRIELAKKMQYVDTLQIFLVFVIMLLNFYWSCIIIKTGYNKFCSKKNSTFVIESLGEKSEKAEKAKSK